MWWVFGVVAAIVALILVVGTPVRRAVALHAQAVRAISRKDWDAASRHCADAQATAAGVKEPLKARIECGVELAWATARYRQGKLRDAEELFTRGFAKARATRQYESLRPAHAFWGDLCRDEVRLPEAEQHYREALEAHEAAGDLAGAIFVLQRLGDVLLESGRQQDAEEAIHRAMELETRVVHQQLAREGKDPAQHTVISWSLPDLHFCRGQYADARRLYAEKVEFWEKSVTRPDNIDLGRLQVRLARCEILNGRHEEGIEMLARAEGTFAREWGESHPRTAWARSLRLANSGANA